VLSHLCMPRMYAGIEGSPGGIQNSYSKRLEQELGVLRAVLPTNLRVQFTADIRNLSKTLRFWDLLQSRMGAGIVFFSGYFDWCLII